MKYKEATIQVVGKSPLCFLPSYKRQTSECPLTLILPSFKRHFCILHTVLRCTGPGMRNANNLSHVSELRGCGSR